MRKYYLSKNKQGYYQARILDPVTGKVLATKSTHTKDNYEAVVIANSWVTEGIPVVRSGSRRFLQKDSKSGMVLNELLCLVKRLDKEDLAALADIVCNRCDELADERLVVQSRDETIQTAILPPRIKSRLRSVAVSTGIISEEELVAQKSKPVTVLEGVGDEVTGNLKSARERMKTDRKNGPMRGGDMMHRQSIADAETVEARLPEKTVKTAAGDGRDIKVIEYMRDFWDYDKSRWVQEQAALGHQVTRRHCKDERGIVDRYWLPYFGEGTTADQIDTDILQEFFFFLSIECELSGATVNHAITCGSAVFKYLHQKKLIQTNPFVGVRRFKKNAKGRSIPTETEVSRLLRTEWVNEPSYLAFYLGAFCGLRVGEICGLRMCDIDEEGQLLNIRHGWSRADGLKATKNSLERPVPCDGATIQRLLAYGRQNPDVGEMSYVFWSPVEKDQPLGPEYYRDGFYEAMRSIGISEEQRKDRNIVFHSLRHFCATILAQRGDLATVQSILGHKTADMTRHYSNHESEEKQRAMREALEKSREYIFSYVPA